MHKLPTANRHPVVLVIHHLQAHPTAVLAIAPIAKQVRRLKHVTTLSQEIIQVSESLKLLLLFFEKGASGAYSLKTEISKRRFFKQISIEHQYIHIKLYF